MRTGTEFSRISISVIILTLNEEQNLPGTLIALKNHDNIETIVVDGGSGDESVRVSSDFGAIVFESRQGRAIQMNLGASRAKGEVLLFLHSDTVLPDKWSDRIRTAVEDPQVCGGAFSLGIEGNSFKLRLIERLADFRSRRFALPYGDQAIFVRSAVFRNMGGFREIPIMEDFEFMGRLKRIGRIKILPERVVTSGRRWRKLGVLRTTAVNQAVILGYYLGVAPEKLAEFYRRKR